jgi:putative transcriptional regulator
VTNRLRVLRSEFRLSQADLAERLGVARQTVHAIETGKFAPSLTLAFKIATAFARDINDVFQPGPQETLEPVRATDPRRGTLRATG